MPELQTMLDLGSQTLAANKAHNWLWWRRLPKVAQAVRGGSENIASGMSNAASCFRVTAFSACLIPACRFEIGTAWDANGMWPTTRRSGGMIAGQGRDPGRRA